MQVVSKTTPVAAFESAQLSLRAYGASKQTHCDPISENPRPEMGT
jgi:hypothetical protein